MCELTQVCKLCTTAYCPQGNGQCQHFNSTLISMIAPLEARDKSHWRDFVPALVYIYNCMCNKATQFSPYFLMFCQKPKLPLDLLFRLQMEKQNTKSHEQVQGHRLEQKLFIGAHELARATPNCKMIHHKR